MEFLGSLNHTWDRGLLVNRKTDAYGTGTQTTFPIGLQGRQMIAKLDPLFQCRHIDKVFDLLHKDFALIYIRASDFISFSPILYTNQAYNARPTHGLRVQRSPVWKSEAMSQDNLRYRWSPRFRVQDFGGHSPRYPRDRLWLRRDSLTIQTTRLNPSLQNLC